MLKLPVSILVFASIMLMAPSCKMARYETTKKKKNPDVQVQNFGEPSDSAATICPEVIPVGMFCEGKLQVQWTPTQPKEGELVTFTGFCGESVESSWSMEWLFDDGSKDTSSSSSREVKKALRPSGDRVVEVVCTDASGVNHLGVFGVNVVAVAGGNPSTPGQNQNQSQNQN